MGQILFRNASLLDPRTDGLQGGTWVLVEGETIRSVGAAKVAPQPGDRVIELDGKTLLPGLV